MLLGTAAYMPPEQARGHAVDKRADIRSFGVVVYEMLAGRRLFDGATSGDILAAVIRQEIDWAALPATTPHHVRQLLRRCLERDPRQRLRDIGEARVLVEQQVSNGIAAAGSLPDATLSRRSQRLRAFWPTLAAVLALFAIVAVGALVRRGPNREYTPLRFTIPALPTMPMALPVVNLVVAVSPDGHRIAFVGAGGIWIWSAATGETQRLEDTEGATAPFFSPDGREVAFYVDEELRRVPVDGGPVTTIVRAPAVGAATWGAGDLIVYNRWLGSEAGVWSVPARGGAPHLVDRPRALPDLHAYPALLPDGRHYLYLRSPYRRPVGERHICVASLDGGKPECFAPGDSNPVYAGTGHVLFVRRGALVALPFDASRRRPTGEAITVARSARWFGPTGAGAFAVSSDGRVLAHASPPRLSRLVWVDRTGRRIGEVGEPARYASLELSPDGRRAAVSIWNSETGAATCGSSIWLPGY
jgi:serine/threonine-protein kinase